MIDKGLGPPFNRWFEFERKDGSDLENFSSIGEKVTVQGLNESVALLVDFINA